MGTREALINMLEKNNVSGFNQFRPFPNVDLYRVFLTNRVFHNICLGGADLRRAYLGGIEFWDAVFAKADARDAKFNYCSLYGADFRDANLEGAHFVGTNLRWANFSGANLRGTNFSGANLEEARFKNVKNFSSGILSGANLWKARDLPEEVRDQFIYNLKSSWENPNL